MTTELHTKASAIDTEIAATYRTLMESAATLDRALTDLHFSAQDRRISKTRWATNNVDELKAKAEARAVASLSSWNAAVWRNSIAKYEDALFIRDAASAAFKKAEEQYEGWSRFFWVANKGGHIHSSMHCHTCYPTTAFIWNPQLSGLTEAEAVEALGPRLCTVCYPSAPVEWTTGA